MYKFFLKPVFFLLSPEQAHKLAMHLLGFAMKIPGLNYFIRKRFSETNPGLSRTLFGIEFPNPVGLAAGFDKDAVYFPDLFALGFGFIEVGTVTPLPQPGNPKPRMFRLPEDEALINRMGFNNLGVDAMVESLKNKNRQKGQIIGGNIGKNKNTPNENAKDDYLISFRKLYNLVDYFVVNVSSPNTPGLRNLQEKEPLKEMLTALLEERKKFEKYKPVLLKIAPDLNNDQLNDIVDIAKELKLDGLVATNTTISREKLTSEKNRIEAFGPGGLSGKPLFARSLEVVSCLRNKLPEGFPIIAVGGIHSGVDALKMLNAGADLIQVYTGFIYEGPDIVRRINKAILNNINQVK